MLAIVVRHVFKDARDAILVLTEALKVVRNGFVQRHRTSRRGGWPPRRGRREKWAREAGTGVRRGVPPG